MPVKATPCHQAEAESGLGPGVRRGVLAGAAMLVIALPPGFHAVVSPPATAAASAATPTRPVARGESATLRPAWPGLSRDARQTAHWIVGARDHAGLGFIIVDKKTATLHVFAADAQLQASSRVLIGAARGDDTVPGIGERAIADVRPHERTTPAGRFVGERGRNALAQDVVWVDYAAAVSIHRVRTTNARERRLERLATPTTDDKRISYGCINVPAAFFDTFIRPLFAVDRAVIYVLPEVKPLHEVFAPLEAAAKASQLSATALQSHGRIEW